MDTAALESAAFVDGAESLVLVPSDLWDVKVLDLGFPVVSEVTEDKPDSDGTDDETSLFGGRPVSMRMSIVGDATTNAAAALDLIRAFLRAGRRPWLTYRIVGLEERRIQLRIDQHSAPMTVELWGQYDASFAWKAPGSYVFSSVESSASVGPGGASSGVSFPVSFAFSFPASTGLGLVNAVVMGTAPTKPRIVFPGPVTNPKIENVATDHRMEFSGLTIGAGDYLELDANARTVKLNGLADVGSNRYRYLDFAVSQWFDLVPGVNPIRYYPASSDAPPAAVYWTPAYL